MDTKENIESLNKLRKNFENNEAILVCTSHNGIHNIKDSFTHINEVAIGTKKEPFDETAPYDIFDRLESTK